jgi:hypothetical protein
MSSSSVQMFMVLVTTSFLVNQISDGIKPVTVQKIYSMCLLTPVKLSFKRYLGFQTIRMGTQTFFIACSMK